MGGELPDGRRRNRQIFKAGFSSPDSDGVLKDEQGELRAKNEIPRLCGNRFPSVDHKLQRYNWKESAWHPANIFSCKADSFHNKTVSHASRLAQLKDIKIGRILYEKPEALKPPRNDVLVVTPWLAPIVWNGAFNRDILNAQFHQMGVRVGLTVFAIKKYVIFLKRFIETAEKFFMVGHKVNYYVFTDRVNEISNFTLAEGRDVVVLEVPAYKRWQDVTMRRMEMIRNFSIEQFVNEVDYLVCVDVDMVFFDDVGVEILSNVFGTLHPGFFGASRQQFTYERRPQSQAYIPFDIGDFYYAGGNFGGIIEEVIKLTNYCHHAMLADKEKNIEALWHDESYLNQYFLFHKPTKVLSPEYIWNYYYGSPGVVQKKRFVGIDKNYKEIRFRRAISNKETANANNSLYLLTEV